MTMVKMPSLRMSSNAAPCGLYHQSDTSTSGFASAARVIESIWVEELDDELPRAAFLYSQPSSFAASLKPTSIGICQAADWSMAQCSFRVGAIALPPFLAAAGSDAFAPQPMVASDSAPRPAPAN